MTRVFHSLNLYLQQNNIIIKIVGVNDAIQDDAIRYTIRCVMANLKSYNDNFNTTRGNYPTTATIPTTTLFTCYKTSIAGN